MKSTPATRREEAMRAAYGLDGDLFTAPNIRRILTIALVDTLAFESSIERSKMLHDLASTMALVARL